MITTSHHAAEGQTAAYISAQIILSTGEIAGEGAAGTEGNAIYFAARAASTSDDEGHRMAGCHYLENYDF